MVGFDAFVLVTLFPQFCFIVTTAVREGFSLLFSSSLVVLFGLHLKKISDDDDDDVDGVSRATLGHADCIPWVSCRYASSGLRGFSY